MDRIVELVGGRLPAAVERGKWLDLGRVSREGQGRRVTHKEADRRDSYQKNEEESASERVLSTRCAGRRANQNRLRPVPQPPSPPYSTVLWLVSSWWTPIDEATSIRGQTGPSPRVLVQFGSPNRGRQSVLSGWETSHVTKRHLEQRRERFLETRDDESNEKGRFSYSRRGSPSEAGVARDAKDCEARQSSLQGELGSL